MKLLKEPEPGEYWGKLVWVDMPTHHWIFYNADGSVDEECIGPIERQQIWVDIANTEYLPPEKEINEVAAALVDTCEAQNLPTARVVPDGQTP